MNLYNIIKENKEVIKALYKCGFISEKIWCSYECYKDYLLLKEEYGSISIRKASIQISDRLYKGKVSRRTIEKRLYKMSNALSNP